MLVGLSYPDLYQKCRESFYVNSDVALRAQLTEFSDHKLIRIKKVRTVYRFTCNKNNRYTGCAKIFYPPLRFSDNFSEMAENF